ncbi:Na+/H+ antiporter NhaA [Hamadaea flava]|uniref:Na(+)/H(+) antiporter NhaA n=1 Tax=Hamadaea flava TaxID=1742688 RepID=A0ABV8M1T1_9ACTN|nr:Na+/H+ antiporter NhaA [Hamadaea flava]MCP2321915.1 Na+/H+ antiporter NhaA [Hamadaea flava]
MVNGTALRTAWTRNMDTPLRRFLRTATGGAAILLGATVVALLWANISLSSYEQVWETEFSLHLGRWGIELTLREWINSGLMTFFFFVVGLEARREFDLGELRERRRFALPLAAGTAGILVPIGIYLLINAGSASAHGWGAAMSTDTALALGMLALVGPRFPDRLRAFLLTVTVVDDLLALVVIALFYTGGVSLGPLLLGVLFLLLVLAARIARIRIGAVYVVLSVAAWLAVFGSGVDPIVVGLVAGLVTYAYPAPRSELEKATDLFRTFREEPTAELEREARAGLRLAVSPNERLQALYLPWTSYLIVPLFALANAGIKIDGEFLGRAVTSPITLGIAAGFVIGKPIGIIGGSWLVTRLSKGRLRPPVGWAAVGGAGTIAGIGFTVSLLVATLAFTGDQLEEAKLGVLVAGLLASAVTWIVFRVVTMLSPLRRARALADGAESIVDLAVEVDHERDHIRGPADARITIVEYGDFECPHCGRAEQIMRELLSGRTEIAYVWRHLPLTDVHPHAQLAAEAAEAAAEQGAFWEMHDVLLDHQGDLDLTDLVRYADQLSLDTDRFEEDLRTREGAARIAEDVDSADLSGVAGTPTFFVNGRRHHGAYDIDSLKAAVHAAKTRAVILNV